MDNEKRPEYTFTDVTSYGINLSTRHNKIYELTFLLKVVDALQPRDRMTIKSMWVDSKCAATDVELHENLPLSLTRDIGTRISEVMTLIDGGHSGICVRSGDIFLQVSANWGEVAP